MKRRIRTDRNLAHPHLNTDVPAPAHHAVIGRPATNGKEPKENDARNLGRIESHLVLAA